MKQTLYMTQCGSLATATDYYNYDKDDFSTFN